MSWITVYITGKSGFETAVFSKLGDHWINGNVDGSDKLIMYWLRDSSLRNFKLAIGAQTIFKYRLRFSTDPSDFSPFQESAMTEMV